MSTLLNERQLQRLAEHKYSVQGLTLLEPMLQVYWNWLLKSVPLWWSPNAITLAGLSVIVISTSILTSYSPDARHEVPGWAYIVCGVSIFIYQSLDSIDGKQARRTNSNTPLGEVLDHGCDAVTNGLIALGIGISFKLGNEPDLFMCLVCFQLFIFYCAHWQAYVSGSLQMYKFDSNEGHFYAIGIHFVTSYVGENIWAKQVEMLGIQLKDCIIYTYIFFALLRILNNFNVIFITGGVGKDCSTVAGTSTIFPLFPVSLALGLLVTLQVMSPYRVQEKHACLYFSCFTVLVSKITIRLMVANLTKSEMNLLCSGLIGPGLMFVNQYFHCIIHEYIMLWICFIMVILDFLWYSYHMSVEICSFLNIFFFTITSKPRNIVRNGSVRHLTNCYH